MSTPIATPVYTIGAWQGNVTDDEGVDWVVETEQGWSTNPPVRPSTEEKGTGDGSWTGPGFYGGRVVVLGGKAVANDRISMLNAKERIKGALDAYDLADLVVSEAHLERTARVRESVETDIEDLGPLAFTWTLQMIAGDPRRYSTVLQSQTTGLPSSSTAGRSYPRTYPMVYAGATAGAAGSIYLTNAGTFRQTPATITFFGPLITPRVEHGQSGKSLMFDLELGWSETLVLDLAAQTALLNGTSSRAGKVTAGSAWFMLGKGANELRFRGTPGTPPPDITPVPTPQMRVDFRSAWK